MDWKLLDRVRRSSSPLKVDLIDHYAAGRVSRRDFIRRGTILGISLPVMGTIITACGSDDDGGSASSSGGTDSTDNNFGVSPAADNPTQGGELRIGIQTGDANSGLDPLNMLDLGTYSVLSQSFEYLVGIGPDGNIGNNGLATEWTPNDDGTAWTFTIREGVTWHDGSPFTSADVAATVDRIVGAGAGLAGVVSEGAVETPDDLTAVVNLDAANGNLPVLLSIYNPQSLMTPADYSDGTTLDARQAGTGPWLYESHDATTFTTVFRANEDYWGGRPNLDTITLVGFDSEGSRVSAMQARELDMIQSFGTVDGASLLADDALVVLTPPSANHR
ncbi:MAG: ABC transporter substrate-binding protein, partial [Actinomycetota bacterium]